MPRLFFALCPDKRVRSEIQTIAGKYSPANSRLVAQNNTHITLAFLGSVDEQTSTALVKGASHLRIAPFSLALDHIGWWRKAKIVWLAPSMIPEQLSRLVNELSKLAQSCGVSLDQRPYRPHVTLARKVTRSPAARQLQPISWNINEFCLMESKTHKTGVEYQVKVSWPLKIM